MAAPSRIPYLILAFAFLFSAHAGAIEPPVLRAGLEAEPVTLDWTRARTPEDRFIASFLMRGLLKYDSRQRPVCDLCQDFEVSTDGRTLTFQIRSNETWSDGVRLEASQFSEAFKRGLQAEEPAIDRISVDGKTTLRLHLREPAPFLPHQLTTTLGFPLRKEFLKLGVVKEAHAQEAVLGPYFLAEWKRKSHLVLEGNPNYSGERPVFRVDFRVANHAKQVEQYARGALDLLPNPTTEDLLKIPATARGKLQVSPYWAVRNLLFRTQKGPLAEAFARRAILLAIDRGALVRDLKTGDRAATGIVPPGLEGYRELPLVTPDLTTAVTEFKKAHASAEPLRLKLLLADLEADRKIADMLVARLAPLKIRLEPEVYPLPEYARRIRDGKFDLALQTWVFSTASAIDLLRTFRTGASGNAIGWTQVAYDGLLAGLLKERSPAEAAKAIDQMTQILEVKEVVALPLGYPIRPFLLGKRVRNFAVTPYGDPDLVKIQLGDARD